MDDHDAERDRDRPPDANEPPDASGPSEDRSRHGRGPASDETVDDEGEPRVEQSMLEAEAENADEAEREIGERHERGSNHGGGGRGGTRAVHGDHEGGRGHDDHESDRGHGDHGGMHEGHEEMFRRRFFVSTLLSIPVLLYSETLQGWLGFSVPVFPGSEWINPVFAVVVFAYGGVPFLRMAVPELTDRSPGMMTLISMAISVAFVYSLASVVLPTESAFFWELVTLIDIMLLGHWIEMRSVRRASSALDELAQLVPDTAERITEGGETEEVPVSELSEGDGVNDAPALTRADVGIAIGSGTDVAVQSADVILVQNNPMDVVRLVKLSRKSYRKMQENIVWAAGYNVFAIPLAAGILAPIGILLSPAVGALLMSLSTVIVAINAQLLRRVDLSIPGFPGASPPGEARPAE